MRGSLRRIVITGGPGAGKTVITRAIVESDPARFALVPEAATQIYAAMQTRWDKLDVLGRRDVQRAIYRLQIEQEQRFAEDHPDKTLILDRGTIDGAAYWPEGPEAYWRDLGTTAAAELSRYDAVIWMQTAAALGIYDGDASNACRFEDPAAAIASGETLARLWGGHPRMTTVAAFASVGDKLREVGRLVAVAAGAV